eukprot:CAMPEP_0177647800 /NCGR_PEP_ID=MMETSP0447-20121125/10491_1 /TAXON_ID=0 /ORGANISM="Stygamoeba regulata, Strain BSH-02190019" /LENGTH=108 /DNA_ID=CAMNT_0019150405 /DNA_START=418 /DNA_END=744 /DNA_ORIENTATION=-
MSVDVTPAWEVSNLKNPRGKGKMVQVTRKDDTHVVARVMWRGVPHWEEDKNEIWLGVALQTPDGKNDGEVDGKRYFKTKAAHGLFVRERNVEPLEDPNNSKVIVCTIL